MSALTAQSSGNSSDKPVMRAYAVKKFGEVPAIHHLPVPAAEGMILVRVKFAGVNPIDYKIFDRLTAASTFPYIAGVDFSGVVESVPSGEHNFKPGDRIFGQTRGYGSYAEYTLVKPGDDKSPIAHIPDGISDAQAASLPIAAITAYGSLDLLNISSGQTLVVFGALGGVGGFAMEMARARGIHVIATVRGNIEEAHSLGAKEVYDTNNGDVIHDIHKSHPKGVDAILDLVNGPDAIRRDIEILKPEGSLVSAIYAADTAWFAEHRIMAYNIASNTSRISSEKGLTDIVNMLTKGIITSRIRSTVELAEAGQLHDKIKHGGLRGKSVIRIDVR